MAGVGKTIQTGKSRGDSKQKSRPLPPALNPESCALVQPYKDFLSKGFISKLTVEFTPMGVHISCKLPPSLRKNGEGEDANYSVGDAKTRIIDQGLWVPNSKDTRDTKKVPEVQLPKKTLTKVDFEATDEKLSARANAVALALTDTVARGRVGSLRFMIEGVDTFEEWWSSASPSEKSRLLMDGKHHSTITDADHLKLSRLLVQCPFRGPVPSPSAEDEEEQPNKAKPPKQGSSNQLVPANRGKNVQIRK
jgi:hypothetical protein